MICVSVVIVGKMTVQSWKMFDISILFLTFHKGALHFLTVKDGKLKFSQIMQNKENFYNLYFRSHRWKNECAELENV